MDEELKFADLMVASEVVETIVKLSAEKVEGVACVGQPSDINTMFSFLSPRKPSAATVPAVGVRVDGNDLDITIHLEGVACVGQPSDINTMFSFLSPRKPSAATVPAVGVRVDGNDLDITIHLTVFFGYPFVTLAEEVRKAVVASVSSQVGARVSRVDVSIDAMVFPKE